MSTIKLLKSSQSFRDIRMLASGAALAQSLPVFFSPLLTRLYSPDDFGQLAVFMAIVTCLLPFATGSYEMTVVLPKREKVAIELFSVAISCGVIVFLIFSLFIQLWGEGLLVCLDAISLQEWLVFVPVALFMQGIFNLNGYYANRHKRYKLLAKARVLQACVMVTVNVWLGCFGVGFVGLMLGNLLSFCFASLFILRRQRDMLNKMTFSITPKKLYAAKKFKDYPLFQGSSGLLNGVTVSLPVFYMSSHFPEIYVGHYALVGRVIYTPFAFISQSVFQVTLRNMVELLRTDGNVLGILKKTGLMLVLAVILPTLVVLLYGPEIFVLIFGDNWSVAGQFAQILAVALSFRFVVSTLSVTFIATNNPRYMFVRRIVSFVFLAIALWVSGFYEDVMIFIIALSLSTICDDVVALFLIFKAAGNPRV